MSRYYKLKSGGVAGFFRRNSNTISLGVIALSIVAVFLLQAITISRLESEIAYQSSVVTQTQHIAEKQAENAKERSNSIADLNRHLDCIVQFFSKPDRSHKAIDDIDNCRISTKSTPTQAENTQPSKTEVTPPHTNTSQKTSEPVSHNTAKNTPKPSHTQHTTIWKSLTNLLGGIL